MLKFWNKFKSSLEKLKCEEQPCLSTKYAPEPCLIQNRGWRSLSREHSNLQEILKLILRYQPTLKISLRLKWLNWCRYKSEIP
jgi:hypothetical protein